MIRQSDSIALSTLPGCPRFSRPKGKVKYRLRRKKRVSARRLWMELCIADKDVWRIMKNDLLQNSNGSIAFQWLNDQMEKNCKLGSN